MPAKRRASLAAPSQATTQRAGKSRQSVTSEPSRTSTHSKRATPARRAASSSGWMNT